MGGIDRRRPPIPPLQDVEVTFALDGQEMLLVTHDDRTMPSETRPVFYLDEIERVGRLDDASRAQLIMAKRVFGPGTRLAAVTPGPCKKCRHAFPKLA